MTDDISFKAAWRGFHMMISHKRAVTRSANSGRFATLATKDPFMKVKNGLAGW
jgi:hypothetical protein